MADMRSFFDQSPEDESLSIDENVENQKSDLNHAESDNMPTSR